MSSLELTDGLLAKLAGWEIVKQARAMVAADKVVSADWQPPVLKGMVREGASTIRTGLVIRSDSDAENLCPCRDSRQRGIICSHAIAAGLQYIKAKTRALEEPKKTQASAPKKPQSKARSIHRTAEGEAGSALELFVILPPNLSDAITRGRVMIYLEGKWSRGRTPLNALPLTTTFQLEPRDVALLDAVEALSDGDTPAMLQLITAQFADLLPLLVDHPNVTLGKSQEITIISEYAPIVIQAQLEANGEISLKLGPSTSEKSGTQQPFPAGKIIRGTGSWIFNDEVIQPIGLPPGLQQLLDGATRIPRERVPAFLNLEWPKLAAQGLVEANFALDDFSMEPAKPRFQLRLEGGLAVLRAKLDCFYGQKGASEFSSDMPWLPDPQAPTVYRARDFRAEQEAAARLLRNGFTGPDAQGVYHLNGQNGVINFFAREYPRLEKEWEVRLEPKLEASTHRNFERIEPKFQVTSSGESWFDLNVAYNTSAGERFSPADIQRLLLSGQSHARLKNGKFVLLDTEAVEELQQTILDCAPEQHGGGYRISNLQAGFLDSSLKQQQRWEIRAPTAWSDRAAQQRGDVELETPPLGTLDSVLRPYQKTGVAWLHFLRTNGFGGILADEMGLGKTVQVLALLAASMPAGAKPTLPSLVVCPTSLIFNWAAEANKFTPQLRVLALQGPQRVELFSQVHGYDLIITSYGLLRRDADHYRALEFDTVILDEAQHIKNRQTQNAQAVKSIRSNHRLVLTGTPLENSVLDLWSIFDFLMPGYLGSAQDFRERYEQAILRDKNVESRNRLARRLRPFMLRRLKRDVATDLPEKLEHVSYCELNPDQRAIYQQVLEASRKEIVNAVDANGLARSRMVVLTALLRLRQICCDLRLLKLQAPSGQVEADAAIPSSPETKTFESTANDESGSTFASSGKLDLFNELLEEILDGNHRVLVFSQFTTMLGLLRDSFSERGIQFCYLDGTTKDRATVVEKFQTDANIPVFLISLKAGGVGLNLTGADTVIHFDPWWNPAVEAQATDRAHRIGQKKIVTSYKLISRGTVEEKILSLQTRKRELFQGMLAGEEQLPEALNWQEIQDLLAD